MIEIHNSKGTFSVSAEDFAAELDEAVFRGLNTGDIFYEDVILDFLQGYSEDK